MSSEPVTRAIAAKSPEVCGPLLYNKSRRQVGRHACVVPDDCEGGFSLDSACFEAVHCSGLCVYVMFAVLGFAARVTSCGMCI